jgi:hypothetical protein
MAWEPQVLGGNGATTLARNGEKLGVMRPQVRIFTTEDTKDTEGTEGEQVESWRQGIWRAGMKVSATLKKK